MPAIASRLAVMEPAVAVKAFETVRITVPLMTVNRRAPRRDCRASAAQAMPILTRNLRHAPRARRSSRSISAIGIGAGEGEQGARRRRRASAVFRRSRHYFVALSTLSMVRRNGTRRPTAGVETAQKSDRRAPGSWVNAVTRRHHNSMTSTPPARLEPPIASHRRLSLLNDIRSNTWARFACAPPQPSAEHQPARARNRQRPGSQRSKQQQH